MKKEFMSETLPKEIDITKNQELAQWSEILHVSQEDIVEAVLQVGNSSNAVSMHINNKPLKNLKSGDIYTNPFEKMQRLISLLKISCFRK